MSFAAKRALAAALVALCVATPALAPAAGMEDGLQRTVDRTIRPLMQRTGTPGMAVGVVVAGRPHVFHYGVASTETRTPVTRRTLFEIGSVSKTFTATLASLAQVRGQLSLSDSAGRHLPRLRHSPFGAVSLLGLATHTAGGFPLQLPEDVRDDEQLMRYLEGWRPSHAPGTVRTYANPGIGMLGLIAARSMGQDFATLMARELFSPLGMDSTFLDVPAGRWADYAQGYTRDRAPARMSAGPLSAQAYGIRTTAEDLLRFLQAQMALLPLEPGLQRAITKTHTGYFRAGPMTQALIWERYPHPVSLPALLRGNSPRMIFEPTPVTALDPAQPPRDDVWINKTGSTNGFGAYAAFVPAQRLGIVLLANRNLPIEDRVAAAHRILSALADGRR